MKKRRDVIETGVGDVANAVWDTAHGNVPFPVPAYRGTVRAMTINAKKLLTIARDLLDYGVSLSSRTVPADAAVFNAMGQAFVDISEAIGDITKELAQRDS